eukprot:Opistho-2@15898
MAAVSLSQRLCLFPLVRRAVEGAGFGRALVAAPCRSYAKQAKKIVVDVSLQPPPPGSPPLGHPWRLVSAVCIERIPLLTRLPSAFEREHEEFSDQIRYEKSKLSIPEIAELERTGTVTYTKPTIVTDPRLPGYDANRLFQPAARVVDPAIEADLHSLERQQTETLYLIVKRNRDAHQWQMPQASRKDTESM